MPGPITFMNFWKQNQIPFSWNPHNTTRSWAGSDHQQSLDRNPNKGLWDGIEINYTYNPQGFRTADLTQYSDQPVDLALGCSLTEGIGLATDQVWPSIVAQERPYPMVNLGIQQASTDTVARILTNCQGLLNIQSVFILWPDPSRFETYYADRVESIIPTQAQTEHVWYMDTHNSLQRFYRNQQIVQSFGLPIFEIKAVQAFDPNSRGAPDRARDGQHWGPESHKIVAWEFIKGLTG